MDMNIFDNGMTLETVTAYFDQHRRKMFNPIESRREFQSVVEYKIQQLTVGAARSGADFIPIIEKSLDKLYAWRDNLKDHNDG